MTQKMIKIEKHPQRSARLLLGVWMLTLISLAGLMQTGLAAFPREADQKEDRTIRSESNTQSSAPTVKAIELFDGKTLSGWTSANFGGEGECRVEDGSMLVEQGYPMSGLTYTGKALPKTNYELSLQAMKTQGDDFFCGLTFPVGDSFCTFVAGGWGGCVNGLSCVDNQDANNNPTRKLMNFKSHQWYKIKVRVAANKIKVWIDEKLMVDQELDGHTVSLRNESRPTRPLGVSNFQTESKFKNIRLWKNVQPSTMKKR